MLMIGSYFSPIKYEYLYAYGLFYLQYIAITFIKVEICFLHCEDGWKFLASMISNKYFSISNGWFIVMYHYVVILILLWNKGDLGDSTEHENKR